MTSESHAIEIDRLVRRYGRTDAVNGLTLSVQPARCYGFFGRNGAGKTTTIKCLLNLLRPTSGRVRVFGQDPQRDEVAVKSRLAYVPDNVAFYIVVYVGLLLRTRGLFYHNVAAFIISMLYAGALAVVIGSVASAEERHLRTIDAQLLVPMRTSRQWLIKIGVVLGLTFLLAFVLPTALAVAFPPERILGARNTLAIVSGVLGVMALATVSLYVSTLCSSGLWALLLSVPAAFAAATLVIKLADILYGVLYSLDGRPDWSVVRWSMAIVTIAVIAVVLRLALANHRSADRSHWRVAAHVASIAGAMIVAATLVGVIGALSR